MKLMMLVPLLAVLCSCASGPTGSQPTTQVERNRNAAAERIADHMASRMDHR